MYEDLSHVNCSVFSLDEVTLVKDKELTICCPSRASGEHLFGWHHSAGQYDPFCLLWQGNWCIQGLGIDLQLVEAGIKP